MIQMFHRSCILHVVIMFNNSLNIWFVKMFNKSLFRIQTLNYFLINTSLETCFSFHKKNNQKIEKCNFSDFTRDFLIIFLQNRFYPDVEFFGWKKNKKKNMFLTDKIARKSFVRAGILSQKQIEKSNYITFW